MSSLTCEKPTVHKPPWLALGFVIALVALSGAAWLLHSRNRASLSHDAGKGKDTQGSRDNDGDKKGTPGELRRESGQNERRTTQELDPRVLLGQAQDWQTRVEVIKGIRIQALPEYQELLFEVAEGSDVGAVREAAIERLDHLGQNMTSSVSLVQRFCARLAVEPTPDVRYCIIDLIGHQYLRHPQENSFALDTLAIVLSKDSDGHVRGNAARVIAYFDRDRALKILEAAREREENTEVRHEIERAIRQTD